MLIKNVDMSNNILDLIGELNVTSVCQCCSRILFESCRPTTGGTVIPEPHVPFWGLCSVQTAKKGVGVSAGAVFHTPACWFLLATQKACVMNEIGPCKAFLTYCPSRRCLLGIYCTA